MKELNNYETQLVSGGIGIALVLSIISGAKGYSLENTVINCAIWNAILGAYWAPALIIFSVPFGATYGALEGFVGYKIGSFLSDDPKNV